MDVDEYCESLSKRIKLDRDCCGIESSTLTQPTDIRKCGNKSGRFGNYGDIPVPTTGETNIGATMLKSELFWSENPESEFALEKRELPCELNSDPRRDIGKDFKAVTRGKKIDRTMSEQFDKCINKQQSPRSSSSEYPWMDLFGTQTDPSRGTCVHQRHLMSSAREYGEGCSKIGRFYSMPETRWDTGRRGSLVDHTEIELKLREETDETVIYPDVNQQMRCIKYLRRNGILPKNLTFEEIYNEACVHEEKQ